MTKRVLMFLAAALVVLAVPAVAGAEPNQSATLDDKVTEFKWSSAPIVGVAPTVEIDQAYPCGSPGHFCDDTLLTLPKGGDLTVKITGTNEGAVDLDLYLYESNAQGEPGKLLRASQAFAPDESIAAPKLKPGFYLARVNSSVSVGGTYDGVATLKNAGGVAVPSAPGAPGANAAPTAKIARLAKSVRGKRLKAFAGTAADDKGVAKVEIALLAVKGSKCSSLNARGAFAKSSCAGGTFLAASGTTKWSYKLRKKLKKGAYQLNVRVTDTDGATSLTKRSFKVK